LRLASRKEPAEDFARAVALVLENVLFEFNSGVTVTRSLSSDDERRGGPYRDR